MRRICFDTETTGISWRSGDRICEIGAVEIDENFRTINTFHAYINPGRPMPYETQLIHGLDDAFLSDKPRFAAVADDFLEFVAGAELIAHNATFDVSFVNAELGILGREGLRRHGCSIVDTLSIARRLYPRPNRNNLNALCTRFGIDLSRRQLHGALLDSEILVEVYRELLQADAKAGRNARL